MIIYVDITSLEKGRLNTGIQRVVKEFLKRASTSTNIIYKIIIKNEDITKVKVVDNNEISSFVGDIKNYQFKNIEIVNLLEIPLTETTVFFDLDSNWHVDLKRDYLYPTLKNNGFLIFNFIYDLIPLILTEFAHEVTAKNFKIFINSIYKNSDFVMFDSFSAESDFLKIKQDKEILRKIPTRVVGLGSDFLEVNFQEQDIEIKQLLDKKYILFVGTIEPRKCQENVIDAFETIANKYPDLNLILIGKKGWKVDALIHKILNHPLKDKQLFWLNNIDDNTLNQFYQNAFLVTYLSQYEGYGLPIAESLSAGNITITSKNSSMYEVGKNIADYVVYNSLNELVGLITLYCDHDDLYKAKKQYIKDTFKTTSWEQFYTSIEDIFTNYEKSLKLKQNHLEKLQFVFISIDKHNLEGTIKAIDKYIDFVKEYIIITQPKLLKEFSQIKSSRKITVIDENIILGEYKDGFSKRDHQSKNWLLRASLVHLNSLDDEFIMLDDDNRPLKEIAIDKFIASDGSYNAYYFYSILDWHHSTTEYDKGQQNMKEVLGNLNYELLSYSSHAPQIINKTIFKEVVDKFFALGLITPIDEWSIYFNYAVSLYPCSFNKKVFETMNWPANPTSWSQKFVQKEVSFENYYKELYDIDFFKKTDTYKQKLQKKKDQLIPYNKSENMFKQSLEIFSSKNMVHETLAFKMHDIELYLSNIPYFVVVEQNSNIKLLLNYKLLNTTKKELDISIVVFLNGNYRTLRQLSQINEDFYQESTIELPIFSTNLLENIYDISFNVMVNNVYVFSKVSPYIMKLIVVKNKDILEVFRNPQILEQKSDLKKSLLLKDKIKSIPFIGGSLRWTYNLLRLNNIMDRVYTQEKQINDLTQLVRKQQLQITEFSNTIDKKVAKEISFQSVSFQQRIDQFIFDAKIDLKNDKH